MNDAANAYALAIAVIAGLLEAIPYVGPLLTMVLAGVVGLSVSPAMAAAAISVAAVMQLIESTIVVPRVMDRTVGVWPVMTLLAFVRPIIFLLLLPIALWQWEDWRNDKYILDRDRLITVDTLPLGLDETVKENEIRRVVDATVRVEGLLPNLLRFGTVVMKTPGEATQFDFDGVPRPFEVHQEIMTRLEAQREQEQAQWDRDIQDWLRTYVEERRAEPAPPPPPPSDGWTVW